jgi:TolA-binding protein
MIFKAIPLAALIFVAVPALQAQDAGEVRAMYMQGVQALANSNLLDAQSFLEQVIAVPDAKGVLDRYKSRAFYFLGDVFFIRQDYPRAVDNYRAVVQKYQKEDVYSKALYKLGRTLVVQSRNDEGIAVLNDYIARYDETDKLSDNALYWIGRGLTAKGDYQTALGTFQNILNKYPDTVLAYDIRDTIATLTKAVDDEHREKAKLIGMTNELMQLRAKNQQLAMGKELLEKMSRLLAVKQRLLEIKSEKIRLLENLKEKKEP